MFCSHGGVSTANWMLLRRRIPGCEGVALPLPLSLALPECIAIVQFSKSAWFGALEKWQRTKIKRYWKTVPRRDDCQTITSDGCITCKFIWTLARIQLRVQLYFDFFRPGKLLNFHFDSYVYIKNECRVRQNARSRAHCLDEYIYIIHEYTYCTTDEGMHSNGYYHDNDTTIGTN